MGVLAIEPLEEGMLFGPIPPTLSLTDPVLLIGHMTADQRPDVHTVRLDILKYSKGPGLVEWVPYVRAARNSNEQNLEAYILDGILFYKIVKAVAADEELFVWYSPELARTIGVPDIHPAFVQGGSKYICPYCCKEFGFPYSLRAHMRFKCDRNPYLQKIESKQQISPKISADSRIEFIANNISPPDSTTSCSPPDENRNTTKRKYDHTNGHDPVAKKLNLSHDLSPRSCDTSPRQSPNCSEVSPVRNNSTDDRDDTVSAFTKVEKLLASSEKVKNYIATSGLPVYGSMPHPLFTAAHLTGRHPLLSPSSMSVRPSQIDQLTRMMAPSSMARSNTISLKENIPISIANMAQQPIKNTADLRNLINAGKLPFHPDWRFHFPLYRSQNPIVETILQSATNGVGTPFLQQLNLAQNWCAKCNATFRMTSDLVYHMRSHHKGEAQEVVKKKVEKLKCDVCGETFKERHHLTRHMTSHQEV